MSARAWLAFLFGGLAIVALACSVLAQRSRDRRQRRAIWEARCARWMAKGHIRGYAVGRNEVAIEFRQDDWHHFSW